MEFFRNLGRRLFGVTMLIAFIFVPIMCLAQIAEPSLPPVSNDDFLAFLFQSLGGLKGAGTLAVVGIVVQILLKFLAAPISGSLLKNLKGSAKLLIVSFLSLVSGVVALMAANGLTLGAALVHSTTLTAFMVFGNQLYKQFVEKSD